MRVVALTATSVIAARRPGFSMAVLPPAILLMAVVAAAGQGAGPRPDTGRLADRIRALQREAEQLATQSRTLLGDLRQLEIEYDVRTAEAEQAGTAAADAQKTLEATTARVAELEQRRVAALPDVRDQLVDMYKRGHSGYAQLLFGARSVRDFARASRAVAALSAINERRLDAHRRTLEALRTERTALDQHAREVQASRQQAEHARLAAQRAVAARSALIARIDSRRDLAAQYAGELQVVYDRLQQQLAAGTPAPVDVPLAPFRGALDWPLGGRVLSRFTASAGVPETTGRNGIEIAAPEGTPVHAVHGGTVAFAGPFTGFGTLVIVDHGGNDFTLYGYLASVSVERGDTLDAGAELGRSGPGPGTSPALYFEVRIDGRSVDPLQWLKPRG